MSASIVTRTSARGLVYDSCGPQESDIALICIHGWACRAADYFYICDEMVNRSVGFRIIAINLPGHGNSSTEHYPTAGLTSFANAVLDLLCELNLSSVILAGHSMGVRVVLETWQQVQATHDVTIEGLCFLDGSHYSHRKSLFAFDSADPRSASLSVDQKREKMAEAFTRMFSPNTPMEFQAATIAHVKAIDYDYNEDIRRSFIRWDHEKMDDALAAVGESGLPVLSFQATTVDDQNQRISLAPGEPSRWMTHIAEKIHQVRQVVVPDSGHFPHVDQWKLVASEMMAFVHEYKA